MDDVSKKIPVIPGVKEDEKVGTPQVGALDTAQKAAGPEPKKLVQEKKDIWEKARQTAELKEQMEVKREVLPAAQEKDIIGELRREIEEMKLEPGLVKEAEKKAKKIEFLGEKEKLEHLMELVNEKGVEFAVKVAKSMGDPYILDLLHDILIKEGFYRRILNQVAQSSAQAPSDDTTQNPPPPPAAKPLKPTK